VGLVHGIGGSGGLTLLLLSTISEEAEAAAALLIFAAGTAVSMTLLSTAFGLVIAGGPVRRNLEYVAPVLGALSMAFGGLVHAWRPGPRRVPVLGERRAHALERLRFYLLTALCREVDPPRITA
jgi:hypothetical protein